MILAIAFFVYLLIRWVLSRRHRKRITRKVQEEPETPIEILSISCHVGPLEVKETSSCETFVETKVEIDKPAKSSPKFKVRIEIDPPEHQP